MSHAQTPPQIFDTFGVAQSSLSRFFKAAAGKPELNEIKSETPQTKRSSHDLAPTGTGDGASTKKLTQKHVARQTGELVWFLPTTFIHNLVLPSFLPSCSGDTV